MWTEKKQDKAKQNESTRGSITIFLVIVIPLILISSIFIYDRIQVKQKQSAALKLSIACSEARLSRYNSFLFERYGLLAYVKDDTLEETLQEVFKENRMEDGFEIEITEQLLSDPSNYLKAVREAAPSVIGEILVDEIMSQLEQNESVMKAQKLINDKIQRYNKFAEKIERTDAYETLKIIVETKNSEEFQNKINLFRTQIDRGTSRYYLEYNILNESEYEALQKIGDDPLVRDLYTGTWSQEQLQGINEQFLDETNELYKIYISLNEVKNKISAKQRQKEINDRSLQQLYRVIQSLYQMDPLPIESITYCQDEIQRLIEDGNVIDDELDVYYEDMETMVYDLIKDNKESQSIIDGLKELGEALKQMAVSKLVFENLTLPIKAENEYSESEENNRAFSQEANSLPLRDKVMICEYLMTVSKSLVNQKVRNFDPLNVKDGIKYKIHGEVEYLLGHWESDLQNYQEVWIEIYAMRTGFDLIGILMDGEKRTELLELTAAIPYPWNIVAYGVSLTAWSAGEGLYDMKLIEAGKGVHLIKAKDEWLLSASTLFSGNVLEQVKEAIPRELPSTGNGKKNKDEKISHLDTTLYYQDYLRLLLVAQGLDRTILRHMELVATQIDKDSKEVMSLEDMSIGHNITIKRTFNYLFLNELSPFEVEFTNGYDQLFQNN